jgi:hypothetical protein
VASPQDIIENALREINVLAAGESAAAEDLEFGRSKYNRMISDWATQRRTVFYIRNQAFTFTTSQQSYTFGPTGNFVPSSPTIGTRPARIERANLVIVSSTPNLEVPLPVINTDSYADLSIPALSSTLPERHYYEQTVPNGTLYP